MVTMVGTSEDFKTVLKDLIELEYDALEAYKVAIDKFDSDVYRNKFSEFVSDHNKHVKDLTDLAKRYDLELPTGPDVKQVLTKGKIVLATLVGDNAILMAMKTNEDDTVTAYERVCAHKGLTETSRPIMERALSDERRHRVWMETTVNASKKAA